MKREDIDIDDTDLSSLERHHKIVLLNITYLMIFLVNNIIDDISLRDSVDSDSEASTHSAEDMSDISDSEDMSSHSIVAGYHLNKQIK